jgi:hypothetical protein
MKPNTRRLLFASALLSAACTTVEYRYVRTEPLKNDDGHVIGQRELLRDAQTGEEVEHVVFYTPRTNSKGAIVGYEDPSPPGTVLRDLDGRRVGVRYSDLRSRGTNPRNEMTIIVAP